MSGVGETAAFRSPQTIALLVECHGGGNTRLSICFGAPGKALEVKSGRILRRESFG